MNRIRSFFENLFHYDLSELSKLRSIFVRLMRFIVEVIQEFLNDGCFTKAAGMAYTSLLALVPATAVSFSIFASFGAFENMVDQIQQFLFTHMIPTSSDVIIDYIKTFQANTRTVNLIGMIALVVTTILMFNTIESSFNSVFQVRHRRSIVRKFMAFTSVIIWGPILLGASFFVTKRLKALINFDLLLESMFFNRIIYFLLPFTLTWAFFILAYLVLPSTRVKVKSAVVGGVIGGALWELIKIWFSQYVGKVIIYKTLYGSLAVIPIFLVWLYLTFLILLFGLEIVYTHQNFESLMANRLFKTKPRGRERVRLGFLIFGEIARAHSEGRKPPTLDELVKRFLLPYEIAGDLVDSLTEKHLIARTDEISGEGFLPARSLEIIPVIEVIGALYGEDRIISGQGKVAVDQGMEDLLDRYEAAAQSSVKGLSFADLLKDPVV